MCDFSRVSAWFCDEKISLKKSCFYLYIRRGYEPHRNPSADSRRVGTRPILPDELEQYELHHRARIAIKPGITGMWQVSGRSDITDFEEIVRLDTEYISEWNIGLDIKILFKTVLAVLKRDGSC